MNPSGGKIFHTHIQTGPWAHPASNTMSIMSFPEVKKLRCGLNHPPTSSVKVKVRVQLHLYSPSVPTWYVIG